MAAADRPDGRAEITSTMMGSLTMRRKNFADGSGQLPALEEVCSTCSGAGEVPGRRDGNVMTMGGECNVCHGIGAVITDDGRRLLEFLHWHRR